MRPVIKAARAPQRQVSIWLEGIALISPIFRSAAPQIAGIERIKENLAAVLGSIPKSMPTAIVDPEREIPGRIANP